MDAGATAGPGRARVSAAPGHRHLVSEALHSGGSALIALKKLLCVQTQLASLRTARDTVEQNPV